ncbi:MAG: hypothetical protein EPN36_02310 [Rhodanobacteraceae bacterium]|nr:MAG: hypothetical protein EPN36_02310 [Rhodanobacteraceae bacterium]
MKSDLRSGAISGEQPSMVLGACPAILGRAFAAARDAPSIAQTLLCSFNQAAVHGTGDTGATSMSHLKSIPRSGIDFTHQT